MKVEANLTTVKSPEGAETVPPQGSGPSSPNRREGIVILISQENRRAWRTAPESLTEAQKVLQKVQGHVGEARQETLAEVHQLTARCLLKLW